MASLDSLGPSTPNEAARWLDMRARRRLDGFAQGWSILDALAARVLVRHFRTRLKREAKQ